MFRTNMRMPESLTRVEREGELREYIVAGVTDDELKRRLKVCLGVNSPGATTQAAATPVSSSNASSRTNDDLESSEEQTAADRARRESIRAGKRRADAVIETKHPQNDSKPDEDKWQHQQRRRVKQEREERER